jgi:hypothetical protein
VRRRWRRDELHQTCRLSALFAKNNVMKRSSAEALSILYRARQLMPDAGKANEMEGGGEGEVGPELEVDLEEEGGGVTCLS